MSVGNCIIFDNTVVQKEIFVGLGIIQKISFRQFSFFKREFGTNSKEREKTQKLFECVTVEMVKRRGVDLRVVGFKVKKSSS
jgi:hypothetical protein